MATQQLLVSNAAVGYGAKNGRYIEATAPRYGVSHKTKWTVLLFITWTRTDAIPHEAEYSPFDVELPELPP